MSQSFSHNGDKEMLVARDNERMWVGLVAAIPFNYAWQCAFWVSVSLLCFTEGFFLILDLLLEIRYKFDILSLLVSGHKGLTIS